MANPLFSVPIPALGAHPGGVVTASEPAPKVYLLTFTSPPDNRTTTALCQALLLALDIIEAKYPKGVVVTTSGIGKFFSNGLDLEHAFGSKGFWEEALWPLFRRYLT
jgi:Delta3-Delta2-enoyl-CoA isomerase